LTLFIVSLSKADLVYLLPIFASAREKEEEFQISSKKMVTK